MKIYNIIKKELLEIIEKEIIKIIDHEKLISKQKNINRIKDLSLDKAIESYSNISDGFEKKKADLIKAVNDDIVLEKDFLNLIKNDKYLSKLLETIFLLDKIVKLEENTSNFSLDDLAELKNKKDKNPNLSIYHIIYSEVNDRLKKEKRKLFIIDSIINNSLENTSLSNSFVIPVEFENFVRLEYELIDAYATKNNSFFEWNREKQSLIIDNERKYDVIDIIYKQTSEQEDYAKKTFYFDITENFTF